MSLILEGSSYSFWHTVSTQEMQLFFPGIDDGDDGDDDDDYTPLLVYKVYQGWSNGESNRVTCLRLHS